MEISRNDSVHPWQSFTFHGPEVQSHGGGAFGRVLSDSPFFSTTSSKWSAQFNSFGKSVLDTADHIVALKTGSPFSRSLSRTVNTVDALLGFRELGRAIREDQRTGDSLMPRTMEEIAVQSGKVLVATGIGVGAAALAGVSLAPVTAGIVVGATLGALEVSGLVPGATKAFENVVRTGAQKLTQTFAPKNLLEVARGVQNGAGYLKERTSSLVTGIYWRQLK